MDGSAFDALSRALAHAHPRRTLTRLLAGLALGGPLPLLGRTDTAAKHKKHKKRTTRPEPPPSCTPSCAGKVCGDDGCGGSCGPCFRGSCQDGRCLCPEGQEFCHGGCFVACGQLQVRHPETCDCCTPTGQGCAIGAQCCTGVCGTPLGMQCAGRNGGEACTWDGQCESGVCQNGTCTCDGEFCKGICHVVCDPSRSIRNPDTCACCLNNGIDALTGNCTNCCSGTCHLGVCTGLPDGTTCSFDAQCVSGRCVGTCLGGIGT